MAAMAVTFAATVLSSCSQDTSGSTQTTAAAGPTATNAGPNRSINVDIPDATIPDATIPDATVPVTTPPPVSTSSPALATPPPATGPRLDRVLTVGDGVMFDLEPAMAAALSPAVVRPRAYLGSGLSNPDHYDWATTWPEELSADGGAQLVVVLLGVWDARVVDTTIGGRSVTLSPGTAAWEAWYRDVVERAARTLSASGAHVVWILPLTEPDPAKSERLAAVESVIVDVVSHLDGQGVVDGDLVLAGAPNHYLGSNADGAILRKNDGEHLCPDGAAMLAGAVAAFASRWFSITPAAGWSGQPWRSEQRYDDPTEGCRP